MKTKNKIITLCLAFVMMVGIVFIGSQATVSAATGPAPSDWAFEESSRPLNDAIAAEYPALADANGYVTIPLANAKTGELNIINKGVTGTINGIENFININYLNLRQNKFSGNIPTAIGNLTSLNELYLNLNNFNGTIPNSIGNLANLTALYLGGNLELGGELPVELGTLTSLQRIGVNLTNISGSIPDEIGNLASLTHIYLDNANFSGNIPNSLFSLPSLINVQLQNNPNLTGNPATGFASSTTLNYLDIRGTGLIQASPEIPTLGYAVGTFLYDNLASDLLTTGKTSLNGDITQADIDKAQESANFIGSTFNKQQWQADINLAQQMLDAKDKVDTLLVLPDLNDLNVGITEQNINDAQDLVTALPNGTLKDELQAKVDTAKNLLDAKEKTYGLVNPDGSLGAGVDQGKIDRAQNAVNKLPDGKTKTELQKIIDDAQKLLHTKNSKGELSTKPAIIGGDTISKGAVSTGDTTNLAVLYAMIGASLTGLVVVIKRKKQVEQ